MVIETQAAGPFMQNGFIVACDESREAVIIDPGDGVRSSCATAQAASALSTLCAPTIFRATSPMRFWRCDTAKRALNVPIYLHRDDLFLYDRAVESGAMFGLHVETPPPIDVFYSPGQVIAFGSCEARPHHTPGHCPGGVCLQIGTRGQPGKDLFVGDTLFAGSIGRTDLPGGDYNTLISSIRDVLFAFGDDAIVHPGHGPATTIGRERKSNPFLVATLG